MLGQPGHALVVGTIYGVINAIGPDHLCTVLTLVVSLSPKEAFFVGTWWGIGHTIGIIVLGVVFGILGGVTHGNFNDSWECWGNFFIGGSMVLLACYYFAREPHYLQEREDGTFEVHSCECHKFLAAPKDVSTLQESVPPPVSVDVNGAMQTLKKDPAQRDLLKKSHANNRPKHFCTMRNCCPDNDCCNHGGVQARTEAAVPDCHEHTPLLPSESTTGIQTQWSFYGTMLGIFQGLCCPVGLAGITAMLNLSSVSEVVAFVAAYFVLSFFALAVLAAGWAWLVNRGADRFISQKTVYRLSCSITFTLGVAWIVMNIFGHADSLDYADSISKSVQYAIHK